MHSSVISVTTYTFLVFRIIVYPEQGSNLRPSAFNSDVLPTGPLGQSTGSIKKYFGDASIDYVGISFKMVNRKISQS